MLSEVEFFNKPLKEHNLFNTIKDVEKQFEKEFKEAYFPSWWKICSTSNDKKRVYLYHKYLKEKQLIIECMENSKDNVIKHLLKYCIENHMFSFVNGSAMRVLEIDNNENKSFPECPICFDNASMCVITNCSHEICIDCVKKLLRYNKNSTKQKYACPLCRYYRAYEDTYVYDYENKKVDYLRRACK